MSFPLIDIQHASVARDAITVLHDVMLRLGAGEHLAILGPNGSGKSTLLKLVTCEVYPLVNPETRVSILGRTRWDVTELRRKLGVVSADLPGKATLHTTGYDVILTGFFSSSTLWPNLQVTPGMRTHADLLLEQVGAEKLSRKLLGEMSAGEQRRIMIARALAGSALDQLGAGASARTEERKASRMLLLDEPSNALDLAAQHELSGLLRRLAKSGTSILLITHHVADIFPEIERVLMMQEGHIVADGNRAELLRAEILSSLFSTPVDLTERNGFLHAW